MNSIQTELIDPYMRRQQVQPLWIKVDQRVMIMKGDSTLLRTLMMSNVFTRAFIFSIYLALIGQRSFLAAGI